MPNEEFLEEYPLYRKWLMKELPGAANALPKARINMACPTCKSHQTFTMTNEYYDLLGYSNAPVMGKVLRMSYLCSHCEQFEREFYVKVDADGKWLMKVGQYPAWETRGEPQIERLLGAYAPLYQKGLVCESQGYGIGAFGYYRRIVEELIGGLLQEVSELMGGDERARFESALEKTRETVVAQEKIELVKDLLPPILRPGGMNPLTLLHGALSEGLHGESDESCLEQAGVVREILVFLVNQVAASKESAKSFTTGMRKLLEKKAAKPH